MSWNLICLILSLYLSPFVHSLDNCTTTDSLDASLQDYAFKTLVQHRRPHTGSLYKAMLPRRLSGMNVSIVRLRSRRLYNMGANFSNIHIPSRTITVPHVKRLAIVYQDFGNWSSHYYNVPGYSLFTPVIGFMVFDATNERSKTIKHLKLNTLGKPIEIRLSNSTLFGGAKCVAFSSNGKINISEMSVCNVCYSQNEGHFSIVVPLKRQRGVWYVWVTGFLIGFGVVVLGGYVGVVLVRVLKTKKVQVMEKQADEDLVLGTIWVGRSKMPSATFTRTQPILDDGGFR